MQRSRNRLVPILGHRLLDTRRSFLSRQLFTRSSSSLHASSVNASADDGNDAVDQQQQQIPIPAPPPQNIAIVGGGLAGLSTAFHLLEKTERRDSRCRVTIFDTAPVGTSGASSVAGGYVQIISSLFVAVT
jgi:hypothetical protein